MADQDRPLDPEGMEEAEKFLTGVAFSGTAWSCLEGADIAVILTEWDQFRALDLKRMAGTLKDKVLVDLRNIYSPEEVRGTGLSYHSIGRPANAG